MISVVIPTCDRSTNFLYKAVTSALTQTLKPIEVIVVDNGIRDADSAALPEGVKRFRLPPRIGASRARNFGAAMAQGSHVAFLDDDDWWDADFLREAWAVLQAEGTRCVYGRKDVLRHEVPQPYKCPSPQGMTIPRILRRNPGTGGQNLLIEKALFFSIGGFDEALKMSEDKALALEVLLAGERISVAPRAIVVLRHHDGERLRNTPFHKLGFLWKYRNLYGPLGGLRAIVRITHKTLRSLFLLFSIRH
ncbi:glycosyltransferase family 2 protein [Ectothiorhodospira sp. PHS-1]|uniref:glycosyltransferase family 2 protein n=1 Tax=Ectothiorhodospira sp. PHS-1 TaxID=519989 RepID=UPI00143A2A98|nr:glycosyltransferase [Ectothiorhodospira sp. PHS-1]